MGGCSSKPKTAEFEGAMEVQEEKLQDEAAGKSAEAEKICVHAGLKGIHKEQESSEGSIRNPIIEEEHDHLRDMLAETTKHLSAGFDAEGKSEGKRQIFEDDHTSLKEVGKNDFSKNGFYEGHLLVEEEFSELENGSKTSAPVSSRLHEDPIFISICAPEHQETLVISNIGAETIGADTSHDKEVSHLQERAITLQEECMKLRKDIYIEAERTLVLLESVASKDVALELQKDPFEAAEKRQVKLRSQEAGLGNDEEMLAASPSQKKQNGTVKLESQDMYIEAEVEMESQEVHENGDQRLINDSRRENQFEESKDCHISANGSCVLDNHSEERGKEVLVGKSLLLREDAKGETLDAANLNVSANDQHCLAVECRCSLDGGVPDKGMHASVVHEAGSTHAFAESAKSQADSISKHLSSLDNGSQKESTGEGACDESWYILEKVDVDYNHPSAVVFKEQIHMELPENADDVPREISRAAGICDEEVLLSAGQMADPKVIAANRENSEVQPIHVLDPVGLAFKNISAQEMNGPDIDDVWEKLASEFERQESLSRSNS